MQQTDRSFLSSPQVIARSRDFVCIRCATYEDAAEAKVLASIFRGGSGELENTVFAILSPDGRQLLCTPGRGPEWSYRDAAALASAMSSIAQGYKKSALKALPRSKDLRIALNVAACDGLPLIIATGATPEELAAQERRLAELAWNGLRGRAILVSCRTQTTRSRVQSLPQEAGLYVVQPDAYGMEGRYLGPLQGDSRDEALLRRARSVKASYPEHMREGHRRQIRWRTEIPVTDPHGRY